MKFAAKSFAVLAAAGLVMGTLASAPANASHHAKERSLLTIIKNDLKRIDNALFGWLRKDKRR